MQEVRPWKEGDNEPPIAGKPDRSETPEVHAVLHAGDIHSARKGIHHCVRASFKKKSRVSEAIEIPVNARDEIPVVPVAGPADKNLSIVSHGHQRLVLRVNQRQL